MREPVFRNMLFICALLAGIFAAGTAGYMLIEHWDFFDSFYMTAITLTTVGYGEVRPLSTAGRAYTVVVLLGGFGVLTYGITSGIQFLLEGELTGLIRRRRMEKRIQGMKNHYVVCAKGETGKYVIEEFVKTERPVVVVSLDRDLIEKLSEQDVPVIIGNPAEDAVLAAAGIARAAGLVAVLGEDRDNLFVVLSARALNASLRIITQAIEKNTVVKLQKAGADEVVLTDAIGGMRIASAMLRPTVVSFLDTMLRDKEGKLRVEEATIAPHSPACGKSIGECAISEKTGLMIIAVKDPASGGYRYNPGLHRVLNAGDTLVVIGNPEQVKKLNDIASPQ